MDKTDSDAAATPAHDYPADELDELDDLLARHESFRGCFSSSLVDHRMPCTASDDTWCQIVAVIPQWNEFLGWLELELHKLPGEGRHMGLVQVCNICHVRPEKNQILQAAAILYWLLKTHRCVASIQIPDYNGDLVMTYWSNVVIGRVLSGNDSVKSLTFAELFPLTSERLCEVFPSMKRLEELHCGALSQDASCTHMVLELLRGSQTLTVLDFIVPYIDETHRCRLLSALVVNSMLRDLTLCATAIVALPQSFIDFLSSTVALKYLKVYGILRAAKRKAMKVIFQGMLKNETVSSLEAHELSLDSESVNLGAKMLVQSKVLRALSLWRCLCILDHSIAERPSNIDFTKTASWLEAILNNGTLENFTLSLNVWTSECWGQFFRVLSRHGSLKMATLVTDDNDRDRLADIANKLGEIGCEEKVTFVDYYTGDSISLADCKNYSELCAYVSATENCRALPVYQQLSTFPPLTCLSLGMEEWGKELCWLLVDFVSATCTLQTLELELRGRSFRTESHDWWPGLSQSLLRNGSIIDLGLEVLVRNHNEGVECLGKAVAQSKTVRTLRLGWRFASKCDSFLQGVLSVVENYALCHVEWDWEVPFSQSGAHLLNAVVDVAHRNSGYVARAAQFLDCRRCDTPCAAALDRVHRHPALMAELAKVLSLSEADAAIAVRRRFRSIEGMHEFMRLAGVVKARVTCEPRDDGRTRLDALGEQCWAHVRRYLQLDDVVWH
ncbi:hypothetical protein MRX96_016827 [Rhipicephalus microplus]|nr:uncharacterized protein LOC119162097 [Rhipicephalus microplus]